MLRSQRPPGAAHEETRTQTQQASAAAANAATTATPTPASAAANAAATTNNAAIYAFRRRVGGFVLLISGFIAGRFSASDINSGLIDSLTKPIDMNPFINRFIN